MDDHWLRIAAAVILSALVLQALAAAWRGVARARYERSRQGLMLERWRLELAAAEARNAAIERARSGWQGYRKFELSEVVEEAEGYRSFLFRPHDGRPLPPFLPGQYLTLRLNLPGESKPAVRCYSLSDAPRPDTYRITVKLLCYTDQGGRPREGRVSGHLHHHLRPGEIVDLKAPAGEFHPDPLHERPLVLIAGGVGVTPFLSLITDLAERGDPREVWLFHGVRDGGEQLMKERLAALAAAHPPLRLRVCHSRPVAGARPGVDYHHAGRIDLELLRAELPSSNYDFFLCGPPAMMAALPAALRDWGVPAESIHTEAFGPASLRSGEAPAEAARKVRFARGGKEARWRGGSLLELAEGNGVTIDSGCRAGNCGACLTAVKAGAVEYLSEPGFQAEAGSCLPCVCAPAAGGELVLDA